MTTTATKTKRNPTDKRVAVEILQQLGGNKFIAMTGARNFGAMDRGMTFRIPRAADGINAVRIVLTGADLYDVTYMRIHGTSLKTVKTSKGLYNDMLQSDFTQATGLYTSLGTMGNPRAKKNPDAISTFAQLAAGLASTLHIDEMLKKRKKPVAAKRKTENGKRKTAKRNPARFLWAVQITAKEKGGRPLKDLRMATAQTATEAKRLAIKAYKTHFSRAVSVKAVSAVKGGRWNPQAETRAVARVPRAAKNPAEEFILYYNHTLKEWVASGKTKYFPRAILTRINRVKTKAAAEKIIRAAGVKSVYVFPVERQNPKAKTANPQGRTPTWAPYEISTPSGRSQTHSGLKGAKEQAMAMSLDRNERVTIRRVWDGKVVGTVKASAKDVAAFARATKGRTSWTNATRARFQNPKTARPTVKARGGTLYMLTIGTDDDTLAVYLHDGKKDGFDKRFANIAAAKRYASRTKAKLVENPARGWFKFRDLWMFDDGRAQVIPLDSGGWRASWETRRGSVTHKEPIKSVAVAKRIAKAGLSWRRNPAPAITSAAKANPSTWRRLKPGSRRIGCSAPKCGKRATWCEHSSGFYYFCTEHADRVKKTGRVYNPAKPKAKKVNPPSRQRVGTRAPLPARVAKAKTPTQGRLSNPTPLKRFYIQYQYSSGRWGDKLGPYPTTGVQGVREYGRVVLRSQSNLVAVRLWVDGKRLADLKKRSQRRNPPTTVRRRTFEMFQGRRAENVKPFPVSHHAGDNPKMDQLGDLIEIKFADGRVLKPNPRRFKLCAYRGRMWIVGGPLAPRDLSQPSHVLNPIDHVDHVVYRTHKPHHGDPPATHYIHSLGEVTGRWPLFAVDNNGFPVLKGGAYKLRPEGIVD